MNQTAHGLDVRLVIYKRIVEGDLSKFTATSNITQSGGGARDLRFRPRSFSPLSGECLRRTPTVCSGGSSPGGTMLRPTQKSIRQQIHGRTRYESEESTNAFRSPSFRRIQRTVCF